MSGGPSEVGINAYYKHKRAQQGKTADWQKDFRDVQVYIKNGSLIWC